MERGVCAGRRSAARERGAAQRTGEEAEEVVDGDLAPAVVDLDVLVVDVEGVVIEAEDLGGEDVARIARHVVGEHQDDVVVGDPEALHNVVDGEDVGDVAVVEPERRRAHEHRPVVRVSLIAVAHSPAAPKKFDLFPLSGRRTDTIAIALLALIAAGWRRHSFLLALAALCGALPR